MKKISIILVLILLLTGCRKIDSNVSVPDTGTSAVTSEVQTSTPQTEPPEPEPEPVRQELKLIMAGDVLLHEKVANSGKMADGTYNYDHLFKNVRDEIQKADIAIANQEVILGGRDLGLSGYPCFNGAFEVGDALVKAGFNVILHGTNHALDKGKTGLLSCLSFWKGTYPEIGVLGIYESRAERDNIYVFEKNGIRAAILNYTYGTNGIPLPADMPYAVNLLDEATVRADIARAKEVSDFVIVTPHWGTEYRLTADSSQAAWTKLFFECGVDLVIGTHPHVPEPVEMITDGNRSMLVYYSLGNFVNSTAQTGAGIANRMLGALAQVTIVKENGEVKIGDYGVLPIVTHVKSGEGLLTVYKLSDYTQQLASENEITASDGAFSKQYCENLAASVFGSLYVK